MTEEYHGIKRDKIPWNPSIDYEKCISCGTCVEYCKLGVYDTNENQKPIETRNPS
ncbi:MAG: 4Fe-4S binding protein [Candidatus Bathyarchaeota archaeon]